MRIWLRDLRSQLSLSHKEVSDSVGISRSYYTRIELGEKTPSVAVAKKIANSLGFEWMNFFDDECSLKEQKIS